MARLVVPQNPESHAAEHARAVETLCQRRRRRDSIQSIISAFLIVGLIAAILALIAVIPWGIQISTIVAYSAPPEPDEPIERPEISLQARPKPAGPKSSRAKVIAAALPAPVSVPVPDNPIPEGPFGMAEDFGEGFGDSEGDGSGGGGTSFFGTRSTGSRVAFLVDFSGSMSQPGPGGGGVPIEELKKELIRSIGELTSGMRFTVIFFSHHAWTLETEGPNYAEKGWNGLGDPPPAAWYPGTDTVKAGVTSKIRSMPANGNTGWGSPLKMALAMNPPPTTIYLLSDGLPRDGDAVLFGLKEMNPRHVPINTIAFEVPGTPASLLHDIARDSRGKFTLIYKGKVISGPAADRYTSPTYDDL
jgi:hypothetical protein